MNCPLADLAYLVKSGMLQAKVAHDPVTEVICVRKPSISYCPQKGRRLEMSGDVGYCQLCKAPIAHFSKLICKIGPRVGGSEVTYATQP